MPVRCAVQKCLCVRSKESRGIHFFRFPLSVEPLLRAWLKAVNRKDWIPTESSRICELHFKATDFSIKPGAKRIRLKADVVPSKNLFHDIPVKDVGEISKPDVFIKESFKAYCIQGETSKQTVFVEKNCDIGRKQENMESRQNYRYINKRENGIESTNPKVKKLEAEVQQLKNEIEFLKQKFDKDIEVQADVFRRIMCEKEKKYKQKLMSSQMQLKLLKRQIKRKNATANTKIHALLEAIRRMNIMSNLSYDILKEEFVHLCVRLFQNENKNKNKAIYTRRFNMEVKKFMMTLYYTFSFRKKL